MKKILLSSLIAVMAVSAANAKIASTDYVDATKTAALEAAAADATTKADAAEAAAISAAAADATTKADAAEAAAIDAAAADATSKANQALADAKTHTNTEITKLTTTGAIKTNADAIAEIREEMQSVATNDKVTTLENTITKLDGADTIAGSVRQLIKAANEAQDTQIDAAYAKKATTLQGYGIADAYTETEVNDLLSAKADSANVYTKTDIDAKLGAEGTTTKAIEAAAAAADAAAQAAQAAQTTANGAVSVNTEQATAITNLQNADNTINGKFGELNGKTVAQAIADAQTAATYSDTEVRGLISANTTEITTINNSDVMKSGIDSTKVGQIATNTTNIATNTTNIATNTTAINNIKTAEAGAFADNTTAYVLTATRDTNGVLQYKWEEIDRNLLN